MMSNVKHAIKRTLTFLLAFAMVVTSLYVVPARETHAAQGDIVVPSNLTVTVERGSGDAAVLGKLVDAAKADVSNWGYKNGEDALAPAIEGNISSDGTADATETEPHWTINTPSYKKGSDAISGNIEDQASGTYALEYKVTAAEATNGGTAGLKTAAQDATATLTVTARDGDWKIDDGAVSSPIAGKLVPTKDTDITINNVESAIAAALGAGSTKYIKQWSTSSFEDVSTGSGNTAVIVDSEGKASDGTAAGSGHVIYKVVVKRVDDETQTDIKSELTKMVGGKTYPVTYDIEWNANGDETISNAVYDGTADGLKKEGLRANVTVARRAGEWSVDDVSAIAPEVVGDGAITIGGIEAAIASKLHEKIEYHDGTGAEAAKAAYDGETAGNTQIVAGTSFTPSAGNNVKAGYYFTVTLKEVDGKSVDDDDDVEELTLGNHSVTYEIEGSHTTASTLDEKRAQKTAISKTATLKVVSDQSKLCQTLEDDGVTPIDIIASGLTRGDELTKLAVEQAIAADISAGGKISYVGSGDSEAVAPIGRSVRVESNEEVTTTPIASGTDYFKVELTKFDSLQDSSLNDLTSQTAGKHTAVFTITYVANSKEEGLLTKDEASATAVPATIWVDEPEGDVMVNVELSANKDGIADTKNTASQWVNVKATETELKERIEKVVKLYSYDPDQVSLPASANKITNGLLVKGYVAEPSSVNIVWDTADASLTTRGGYLFKLYNQAGNAEITSENITSLLGKASVSPSTYTLKVTPYQMNKTSGGYETKTVVDVALTINVKKAYQLSIDGEDKNNGETASVSIVKGTTVSVFKSILNADVKAYADKIEANPQKDIEEVAEGYTAAAKFGYDDEPSGVAVGERFYVLTILDGPTKINESNDKIKDIASTKNLSLKIEEYLKESGKLFSELENKGSETITLNVSVVDSGTFEKVVIKSGLKPVIGMNGQGKMIKALSKALDGNFTIYESSASGSAAVTSNVYTKEAFDELKDKTEKIKTLYNVGDGKYYVWSVAESDGDYTDDTIGGDEEYTLTVDCYTVKDKEIVTEKTTYKEATGKAKVNPGDGSMAVTFDSGDTPTNRYSLPIADGDQMLQSLIETTINNITVKAFEGGIAKKRDLVYYEKTPEFTDDETIVYAMEVQSISVDNGTTYVSKDMDKALDACDPNAKVVLNFSVSAFQGKKVTKTDGSVVYEAKRVAQTAGTADGVTVDGDNPKSSTAYATVEKNTIASVYLEVLKQDGSLYLETTCGGWIANLGETLVDAEIFDAGKWPSSYKDLVWLDEKGKVWNIYEDPVSGDVELKAYKIDAKTTTVGTGTAAVTYKVEGIPNFEYTGKAIKPDVKVTSQTGTNAAVTMSSKDYKVEYINKTTGKKTTPKAVATYQVKVTLKDKDKTELNSVEFKITKKDIENSAVDKVVKNLTLGKKGTANIPVIGSFKADTYKLSLGKDYKYTIWRWDAAKSTDVKVGVVSSSADKIEVSQAGEYYLEAEVLSGSENFEKGTKKAIAQVNVGSKDQLMKNAKITFSPKTITVGTGANTNNFTIKLKTGETYTFDKTTGAFSDGTSVYEWNEEKERFESAKGKTMVIEGYRFVNTNGSLYKPGKVELRVYGDGKNTFGYKSATYTVKANSAKKLTKAKMTGDIKTLNTKKFDYTGSAWTLENIIASTYENEDGSDLSDSQIISMINSFSGGARYGIDYTVSYAKNVKAGKATITFTAVNGSGWSGSFKQTFNIKRTSVSGLYVKETVNASGEKVDEVPGLNYQDIPKYVITTGSLANMVEEKGKLVLKSGLKITDSRTGKDLVKDTDFTVTYSGNKTSAATPIKITVKGKGNYEGSYSIVIPRTNPDAK